MISDPKVIDSEIHRCLNLLVTRGTEPSFVTTFINVTFYAMEQSPMAQLVIEHMLQENVICKENNLIKISKRGYDICHKDGGWLTYRAKLDKEKKWEKNKSNIAVIISIVSLIAACVIPFIKNSENEAADKKNALGIDSLKQLYLKEKTRIDSINEVADKKNAFEIDSFKQLYLKEKLRIDSITTKQKPKDVLSIKRIQ